MLNALRKVAGLAVLLLAGGWVISSVIGGDGRPTICQDGDPPPIGVKAVPGHPSLVEAHDAQRDLPEGQRAVFNEYTGEFQGVDAVTEAGTYGNVAVPEELVYECNANNEPTLVPLSEVEPQAAQEAHRQMARLLRTTMG